MQFEEAQKTLKNPQIGTKFKVYGYTDSSGNKRDVTFEVAGPDGKKALQEDSLNKILFNSVKRTDVDGGDDTLWFEALKAVEGNIRRSLGGENKEFAKRAAATKEDPNALYCYHLKELERSKEVITKTVNSATKTLVKNSIQDQLPIGSYVYKIKLVPGKFDKIELV